MIKVYSSGEDAVGTTNDDWCDVMEVPGNTYPIDFIMLINEGNFPGFWRLVDAQGESTDPARLPVGGGASGERRAGFTIPCPGFNGKLQVKRVLLDGHLTGIFAFGMRSS